MKSIVLPAGTRHVRYDEIAHLIADALWPEMGPDDERWNYGAARVNLDSQLLESVRGGSLPVKDPLTFLPHTYPVGNALLSALVAVDDLRQFVFGCGLDVSIEQSADSAQPTGKEWTDEKLAEAAAYRAAHGTKKTAEHYEISEQRIRKLLPGKKPAQKGYSAFTHRPK